MAILLRLKTITCFLNHLLKLKRKMTCLILNCLDYLLDITDDCLEKIYSKKIYPQTIKIQVNNGLVYDLTAEEIQNIIRQLDFAGFNVKKLIESAKNISL